MATHIALHAERPVASLEGTFECYTARKCQIIKGDDGKMAKSKFKTYDVRPCGCEHGSRTSKS